MNSNNRFSSLLKNLLLTANLKNTILAQELQYDVSYISKWLNGQILPAEKGLEKILHTISSCITRSLESEQKAQMYAKYTVNNDDDLEGAIYDNLLIEYNYVKELKADTGLEIAPQIAYFPELTLLQFVNKMRHPVLRNVQALNVVAMLDVINMEKNCQLIIADLQNAYSTSQRMLYPGVHFNMLLDLSTALEKPIHNTTFIMNMIANFSNVKFNLYESKQARGKAIFAVDNGFIISGMLTDNNHCIAVTTSEDPQICNVMYNKLRSFCGKNNQLTSAMSMKEFISSSGYMRSILAEKHKWIICCLSEHFISESLFETLLDQISTDSIDEEFSLELKKSYYLTRNILNETKTDAIIIDSTLQQFLVTGQIYFYHLKFHLTTEQRIEYLKNIRSILESNPNVNIRIFSRDTIMNFQFLGAPNIMIADSITHVRVSTEHSQNRIEVMNSTSIKLLLETTFNEIWNSIGESGETLTSQLINQLIHTLEILQRTESNLNDLLT